MSGNGNGHDPEWLRRLKGHYKKTPPGKVRGFFQKYATETACDATKAARLVGYAFPNVQGSKLKSKFPDVVEAAELEWKESCGVRPDELVMHLAEIVRDKESRDRMKAIELNAKIHGMLSDKLVLELDRKTLLTQIDARIAQLVQARAIETGQEVESLPQTVKEVDDFTE